MAAFRFALQVSRTPHRPASGVTWRGKAENLGYATLYVPDHLDDQWAPMVALAVAAESTTTMRVGTLVLDNDFRHPVLMAKEAATLDAMTGGRFELGLGAGWLRADYDQSGIPMDAAGGAHRAAGRGDRDHARHVGHRQRHLRGRALPRDRRRGRACAADARGTAAGDRRGQSAHPRAGGA